MASTKHDKGVVELLNELVELEHDALSAIQAAEEHLRDDRDRVQIEAFRASHRTHLAELDDLILGRDGTPAAHGDFHELLRRAKVMLGALAGEQAILVAMKSNADALATRYEAATTDSRLTDRERGVLDRALADERWHSAWFERRIGLTPDVGEAIMAEEGENERARHSASIH